MSRNRTWMHRKEFTDAISTSPNLSAGVGMTKIPVEVDPLLLKAGECFMYLLWVESTMCDLMTLREGGQVMVDRYNMAYGTAPHPSEFSKRRLELKSLTFAKIRDEFFCLWPKWKRTSTVRESIERAVILRNAFSHAQVQPFRDYLLYNPTKWNSINKYMKCGKCLNNLGDCDCSKVDLAEPRCLKLDLMVVEGAYEDIKTIDCDCLFPTAVDMGVSYRGIGWPNGIGDFEVAENRIEVDV